MSDLILRLIGAAWQIGAAGFLAAVVVSLAYLQFFHVDLPCEVCEVEDCDGTCVPGDEFEGDAWDRALDQRRDESWEIAS